MRISELCTLRSKDVNLYDGSILIYGKGNKERRIQIGNDAVIRILEEYKNNFCNEINSCKHFFANQNGTKPKFLAIKEFNSTDSFTTIIS